MRICIYGAGAMGTSLGALFSRAKIACDLVSRNQTYVDKLNAKGAILCGYLQETVPVTALTPSQMTGTYDLIFLSAKQRDNRVISQFLSDYLAENGALVSVQNGLPEQVLAQTLGAERVYGCTLSWGASRNENGEVYISSESGFHFALGAYGAGAQLNEIATILRKIGEVTVGDLAELRFAKLAVNASFSTLSALSGLTFGQLSRNYTRDCLTLIREVFAVAKKAGCKTLPLNGHDLFRVFGGFWGSILLPIAMKKYEQTVSGMLADLQSGRRCEVDFVAGAVVAEGERLGVPTPKLKRAVALVHEVENGFAELSEESIKLLNEKASVSPIF